MIVWSAGHNMPGYLPESDPAVFEDRPGALAYTAEELRRAAENQYGISHEADAFAAEYEEAADALEGRDAEDGDWYDTFEEGRIAYWFEAVDLPDDEAHAALEGDQ